MKTALKISCILILLFAVVGCPKKVVKKEQPIAPPPEEVIEKEKPEEVKAPIKLSTVYFDFDKYDIRPGDAVILKENAQALKDNPKVKITIEGHCCPIGTSEYNMALGFRRANSVKDYLVKLGIAPDRLNTVSYGEERLVTENPDEYWKNRRCEFKEVGK
ncbi:MAG: OmpA family protein [candidate division WOR-3 bacterium]|nr:OmpA family protein [candidate division WOR-3 bacterium]